GTHPVSQCSELSGAESSRRSPGRNNIDLSLQVVLNYTGIEGKLRDRADHGDAETGSGLHTNGSRRVRRTEPRDVAIPDYATRPVVVSIVELQDAVVGVVIFRIKITVDVKHDWRIGQLCRIVAGDVHGHFEGYECVMREGLVVDRCGPKENILRTSA